VPSNCLLPSSFGRHVHAILDDKYGHHTTQLVTFARMDIQWSAKRSRSTGSRRTVPRSEQEKEVLVYHRRSVQERDAAVARRLAMLEKKEL
jgi:hypothetical protein